MSDESFLTRHGPALALGVVAIAVLLRLPGLLGWWLNPDEGIYYSILTRERFADFWAETQTTAHPPLYFLVLRAVSSVTTDFVWLRSVAFASGVAAVYVFVLVGREIAGPGVRGWLTGLLAGLLLATSPRAIVLSQLIRPYMLLVVLLAGALFLLLRYLRAPSPRLLAGYAACAALSVLLHYSSVLGLAVFGIVVAVDGARRGLERPDWLRLVAAQLVPAIALGTMYLVHLRRLIGSPVAENALEGWLGAFMIQSPGQAWLNLAGFHSMVTGELLAAPAAVLSLLAVGFAARTRSWIPLAVTGSALLIAAAAATAQLYPFGATRHTSWLLVFMVPGLAWIIVTLLRSRRGVVALCLTLLVGLALGSERLGAERMVQEISERVLQRPYLTAMAEVLDPAADPALVFMSTETYHLLLPLYVLERQSATRSVDGLLLHFQWGARDVIVLPTRDFLARPDQVGQPNHLYTAARKAAAEFADVSLPVGEPVLVLAGGWRSQGMADLVELSRVSESLGTTISVPGLIALSLDLEAYGRVLAEASN